MRLKVAISDEQSTLAVDQDRVRLAIQAVLADSELATAEISVAIVDDATIHQLNRQFLAHDEPTDVLSFVLEHAARRLEGEIVVSAETAARSAPGYGWAPEDELLLYIIHGTLHLVGFDDTTDPAAAEMRKRERHYLERLGLKPRGGVNPEA